jgi:hypothetical protein
MSCDHLICAQCSHPVSEGNCPTCRLARSELHHHSPGGISPVLIGILLLALTLLLALKFGIH